MLILLPPSESKAAPARRGKPVALENLCFPGPLTDVREAVLTALVQTSGRPDAVALLGVGASLVGEVERNTRLVTLPASPAHVVYTGVLYDALGWQSLSPGGRRRGAARILISSALFGWTRPNDRIPPYRLSMDGELPGLGPLTRVWRAAAVAALRQAAGRRGLMIDCRSGPYAAAAPIPPELAPRAVAIRVLREQDGSRSVVSHLAKHTRGEVARHLLELDAEPRTPTALLETLAPSAGPERTFELTEPSRRGTPWTLDVVLP